MVSILLCPHRWQKGKYTRVIEEAFANYFPGSKAVGFGSDGTALYQILKGWGVGDKDTVILSTFSSLAFREAVAQAGANSVYADVEEDTFNVAAGELADLKTRGVKAIVVSYIFGQAANLGKIIPWARERGIKIIEDCSHSLGARYRGEKLGTFGDAALFSLGRSGSLDSAGGAVVITFDPRLGRALITAQRRLSFPSRRVVVRGILTGEPSVSTHGRLPNSWAALAYRRFIQIDEANQHRRQVAGYYLQRLKGYSLVKPPRIEEGAEPSFFRFVVRVPDPGRLMQTAKRRRIFLHGWDGQKDISPPMVKITDKLVVLPTAIPLKKAKKVVKVIREHYRVSG